MTGTPTIGEARARFLRRDRFEPSTKVAYARTLNALDACVDPSAPLTELTLEVVDELLAQWSDCKATTFNRHRSALLSFCGWCLERGWLTGNPAAATEPRKVRRRAEDERRDRPIARERLAELWTLDGPPARDKLLWRMAYETWARAQELLSLDIEDLDPAKREGRVLGKGGDIETVWWSTGTARLLPRVIGARTSGPVFLASRLPREPMPTDDLDPTTGRARMSYRQAERLFAEIGTRLDPDGAVWTLHRLRHSGIAHAVEDNWNLAQVRAKSRHGSLRSLEVYANPSADAVRRMTAALDPEARKHRGT